MFSDKRVIGTIAFVLIVLAVLMVPLTRQDEEYKGPQVVYVTPEPTVSNAPTREPIIVIRVTPEPTTNSNTNMPTAVPTSQSTAEPTATPTIEPTPTMTPTSEPTTTPTVEPTPTATQDMSQYYAQIEIELGTLTEDGGIFRDYEISPNYDLYNYISVENLDSQVLFSYLRRPFEDGIATWSEMEFDSSKIGIDKLKYALDSSVCDKCGRIKSKENTENANYVFNLFEEIAQRGEYSEANLLLLNYLYEYTSKSSDNPNERLVIVCNCK